LSFNPSKHHRRSIRLKDFDYSSRGAYTITLCTHKRVPYLANPVYHKIVEIAWKKIPKHFPTVILDTIGIVPDHIHMLIWLEPTEKQKPLLGHIVGRFKSDISHVMSYSPELNGEIAIDSIWQERFYDHIIRNERELEIERRYILENPKKHRLRNEGYQ
jgi:putative transposase